ncbi:MAG TPA: alpha/beta fold hydrolase [Pyrinomonadaceae bacterium]
MQVKQYSIEQFLDTNKIFGSSFSPDECSILFTSNKSGIFNAYTVPVSGGEPRELTCSRDNNIYATSFFPNDERILFTRDNGGNEDQHLFVLCTNGKELDLTPGNNLRADFLAWSWDDKSFYYETNERESSLFDVYRMEVANFERKLIFQDTTGYRFASVSKDDKHIAFLKINNRTDSAIYIYCIETKEMRNVLPHKADCFNSSPSFDIASTYLYYLTDEASEFSYIARYDLETGKIAPLEKAAWSIFSSSFSRTERYRIVCIDDDSRTAIKIYYQETGESLALPHFPEGQLTAPRISKSERLMTFYVNGDCAPSSLYVYDFATKETRKLVNSLNPEINSTDLVESEIVRFRSFDNLEVPALLWKPHNASTENKVPALVWVHGGPGGQTRKGYWGFLQFLVNHRYAVLGVNNRGSSGYGKSFLAADVRKHGREPLWDCVEAKNYLSSLDYIYPSKVGIIGESYGGYMVLAALAFAPDEFTVGVDLFGVSNWLRTLESLPEYWKSVSLKVLIQAVGDPQSDREMLQDISPLFHAHRIKKPLMVLQGANDPRVLKVESDDIVDAVKRNNVAVEYMIFYDEGHGFTKRANETRAYGAILDFLDRFLKNS